MIKDYDVVRLIKDVSQLGLITGQEGTVLECLLKPSPAFLIDFDDDTEEGESRYEIVEPGAVELVWSYPDSEKQIKHKAV